MYFKNQSKAFLAIFLILSLNSCSYFNKNTEKDASEVDKIVKKERFEPNIEKRLEKRVEEGGGGFLFGNKKQNDFGGQNIMWAASMEALNNIPLSLASYNGGIIETDWYGNEKEMVKVRINFLSSTVSPSSLEVTSYKKICTNQGFNCKMVSSNSNFDLKIKNKIFQIVKELNNKKKS